MGEREGEWNWISSMNTFYDVVISIPSSSDKQRQQPGELGQEQDDEKTHRQLPRHQPQQRHKYKSTQWGKKWRASATAAVDKHWVDEKLSFLIFIIIVSHRTRTYMCVHSIKTQNSLKNTQKLSFSVQATREHSAAIQHSLHEALHLRPCVNWFPSLLHYLAANAVAHRCWCCCLWLWIWWSEAMMMTTRWD